MAHAKYASEGEVKQSFIKISDFGPDVNVEIESLSSEKWKQRKTEQMDVSSQNHRDYLEYAALLGVDVSTSRPHRNGDKYSENIWDYDAPPFSVNTKARSAGRGRLIVDRDSFIKQFEKDRDVKRQLLEAVRTSHCSEEERFDKLFVKPQNTASNSPSKSPYGNADKNKICSRHSADKNNNDNDETIQTRIRKSDLKPVKNGVYFTPQKREERTLEIKLKSIGFGELIAKAEKRKSVRPVRVCRDPIEYLTLDESAQPKPKPRLRAPNAILEQFLPNNEFVKPSLLKSKPEVVSVLSSSSNSLDNHQEDPSNLCFSVDETSCKSMSSSDDVTSNSSYDTREIPHERLHSPISWTPTYKLVWPDHQKPRERTLGDFIVQGKTKSIKNKSP